jgi:hypothetical protein
MNIRLQCADRNYQTLNAGQTCEIISIIEKIRSIIYSERLDLMIFLDEMSYPADPEALQALLVICQSK